MLREIFNSINPLVSDYEVRGLISPQKHDAESLAQCATEFLTIPSGPEATQYVTQHFNLCKYIGTVHTGRLWTKRAIVLLSTSCAILFILISLGIISISAAPSMQLVVGIGGATLFSTLSLFYLGALAFRTLSLHYNIGYGSCCHQLYFSNDVLTQPAGTTYVCKDENSATFLALPEKCVIKDRPLLDRQALETKYVW